LPPALEFVDEVLGTQPIDDLCLREAIAQTLALRVAHHGEKLEHDGGDVHAGNDQHDVPSQRRGERCTLSGLEVDHHQPE
jgi:hypothetical protein